MPGRYPYLLFDADDTLFDYAAAEAGALREAFETHGVAFDPAWLPVYGVVNARAWKALEEGRLSSQRIRVMRFEELFAELGIALDADAFSPVYLQRLAAQSQLLEGAEQLVADLAAAGHRLAIVTNGIADVQRPRLAAAPISRWIEHLVISEEVGAAKPDPAIFDAALARFGNPERGEVLMIGDNPGADIAGAAAAGIASCWVNPARRAADGVVPTFEIRRIEELRPILLASPS